MSSIPDQAYIKDNSAVDQILTNLAHIPAFAFLTFFWLKTFNLNGDRLFSNLLILSAFVLSAVSTEFLQSYVPGRTASFMDFGLNVIGILFGFLIIRLFGKYNLKIFRIR
jgi:VanZ family protein